MDISSIPPNALWFLVAMMIPTVPFSLLFCSIWLLLIHHGAEPAWPRTIFHTDSLYIWRRIQTGDVSGLDEASAAKFFRLRAYLVRAAQFWGAWLFIALIVLYVLEWSKH